MWAGAGRALAAELTVADKDVIDLATGTGVTAIAAAKRDARSVTGVDIAPPLLTEARRRAASAGLDVEFVEADMAATGLPAASADLVVSTFGLVFGAEIDQAIAEARRLIRPGGELVFTSWSGTGYFAKVRQTLAPYFPDAGTPWHESAAGIKEVAGPDADVDERFFTMAVESPEVFIDLMHRHSGPIILGAQSIGSEWPEVRGNLIAMTEENGERHGDEFRIPVGYLVTTIRP